MSNPLLLLDSSDVYTPPEVYTPQEIAGLCGLSRRRVYDWLAWGWLRGHRRGGRWVVTGEDWEFFVQACRTRRGRLMPSLRDWSALWATRDEPSAPDRSDGSKSR